MSNGYIITIDKEVEYMNNTKCIDNIYALAKQQGMKIGDLEEKVGLSKGYFARLKRDGNNSFPTVEKIYSIAEQLRVRVDLLMNGELTKLSDNELIMLQFIEKLYVELENHRMKWDKIEPIIDKEKEGSTVELIISEYDKKIKTYWQNASDSNLMHGIPVEYDCEKISYFATDLPGSKKSVLLIYAYISSTDLQSGISDHMKDEIQLVMFSNELQQYDELYEKSEKDSQVDVALEELTDLLCGEIYTTDDTLASMKKFIDFDFKLEK